MQSSICNICFFLLAATSRHGGKGGGAGGGAGGAAGGVSSAFPVLAGFARPAGLGLCTGGGLFIGHATALSCAGGGAGGDEGDSGGMVQAASNSKRAGQ